ncbi:hypothetical protein [Mycolicibacterium fortuitum]|uniref:Uncharacterized protein n=1 Tax=Mycobacterium phage Bipper TaxID=1805457 RepID=A0A142F2K0_9CAUD|nr:hypothetical protein [Mycolicibacterium fortuitum]YP_009303219.1 hypothetical protein KCH39_gp105 [Mycobacterium phage Bipper]AMQ67007.1 hypothetical protein SEA_BIPPER_72 [Mycobacterium phage Bipper]QDF19357.1 hypothetical protein SEA_CRACKLEWINK_71 [Mycobacterium phage Cracklewink]UBV14854.1 hypothetical protein H8Z57_29890 [Mycolicibacterium fortuitum]
MSADDQPQGAPVFMVGGNEFHLLGYATEEGFGRAVVADEDKVIAPYQPPCDEVVVVCDDCPTTRDEKYGADVKAEWVFPKADDAWEKAEAFAKRHNSLQNHKVSVLGRTTLAFKLNPGAGDGYANWDYMLGQGDAGADR